MSFVIYQSSAGSGKTFTLVKEYLKIVIKNPEKFRHVLAVTFTNKAANEMKERVITKLKNLADYSIDSDFGEDPMLIKLMEETGLDKATISKRSRIVLELILHNYSEFAIGTIDSFMHKVIRTFAHDLKIPLNFDVELDSKQFTEQAIDVLISQVGHDKELTKALLKFIESKTDAESSWRIDRDLQKFTGVMMMDDSFPYLKKLKNLTVKDIINIDKKLLDLIRGFESVISGMASRSVELIEGQELTGKSFHQGERGIFGYLQRLNSKNFKSIQPNSYALKTGLSDDWLSPSALPGDSEKLALIQSELIRIFASIHQLLEEQYNDYILFQRLRRHIYPIAVLNEIEKVIEEFRESENVIHISEFNRRISEIVSTEPVPFIYERLGERYQHYLVDEFQDTSILQWHNLIPLFENSLGYGNFNMVVGDVKQAIYRWRGGDAEQFINLPKIKGSEKDELLAQREQVLASHYDNKNLKQNYRSRENIVRFNNQFFDCISELLSEGKKDTFNNIDQGWVTEKTGGYVHFDFIEEENKASYEAEVQLRIEQLITELKADLYNLQDITILCRSNRQASLVARHLLSQQISVISSESLLLSASPKVSFLIACMQYAANPEDSIARTEINNFLINSDRLPNTSLSDAITITPQITSRILNLSLYEMVEELIRTYGFRDQFDPYIQFFLDTVIEYTSKKTGTVMDFLEWWYENNEKRSIVVSEGQEAVQVMTIHKAKGLEFPVVIFPFADELFSKNQADYLWVDIDEEEIKEMKAALIDMGKQLEDTKFENIYREEVGQAMMDTFNLLYVAMTRPTDRLYIMSKLPSSPKEGEMKNIAQLFVHYLKHIDKWNEEVRSYEFGNKLPKEKSAKKSESGVFNLESLISEPWRDRLLISTLAPEAWDLESPDKSREWGNLIHHLLSKIEHKDDCEKVINDARLQGVIDSPAARIINGRFEEMMNHPELSAFFTKEWEVRNEAEIFHKTNSYRPDRLMFKGDDVVILDYKTGKEDDKYFRQLDVYASKLQEMSYNVIGKYLVYIGEHLHVVVV